MDESWSCPSLVSYITGLISIPLPSPADIEPLHMYNTPLRTFCPLSCMDIPADDPGRAHSSLLIYPRGVLLAWCRADARQSACCGDSSISLPSGVGSSRVKTGTSCSWSAHVCTWWHVPLYLRGNEKKKVMMEDGPCSSSKMHEGMLLAAWCPTLCDVSSHQSLIPLFPQYKCTLTKAKLPGSNETALICWSQYHFCHCTSTVDWSWVFLQASDNPRGHQRIHWHTCASVLLLWLGSKSQLVFFFITQTWGNLGYILIQLFP